MIPPWVIFHLGVIVGFGLAIVLRFAWYEAQAILRGEPETIHPPVPGCDCSVCREERRRRATTEAGREDHG